MVNKVFNHKWNPSEAMQLYERAFSPSSWNALPMAEKQQHSLRDCKACKHLYGELPSYFPVKDTNAKSGTADENSVTIMTGPDTTLKQVGKQILNKLSPIVQEQFDMTLQQVLVETPKSKHKRNSAQKLDQKRTILRQFHNQAQAEYDHVDEDLVMQHRMSFSQFDTMRKILGLKSTPSRKRKCKANSDTTPIPPKRRHGNKPENMGFDTDRLLQEAKQWGEDKSINWSEKARLYGITKLNGGQIINPLTPEIAL